MANRTIHARRCEEGRRQPVRPSAGLARTDRLAPILLVVCAVSVDRAVADEAQDRANLERLFARRARALKTADQRALRNLYDGTPGAVRAHVHERWDGVFRKHQRLSYESEVRLLGVHGDRALVRESYRLAAAMGQGTETVFDWGDRDFALVRTPRGWRLTLTDWSLPNIERDVLRSMAETEDNDPVGVLHLVAELRGGQWRPDRYTWWTGTIRPVRPTETPADGRHPELMDRVGTVLAQQYRLGQPGWVHLFLQKNGKGWQTAGGTWYETPVSETKWDVGEREVRRLRSEAEDAFGDPLAHVRLSEALSKMGLFAEALEELERAEALQPGAVPAVKLAEARARVADDPLTRARRQVHFESALDVAPDHPMVLVAALKERARRQPRDPEIAAMLGIELARIAADREAAQQLRLAQSLARGRPKSATLSLFLGELERQVRTTTLKPTAAVRSKLFTLRFTPGDEGVLRLMAALERARHAIYAHFRMPLGGTEVLLFPDRASFEGYTLAVRGHDVSGLTAAYAVGEQLVTFSQLDTDNMGLAAHELGHLAMRRVTRHRPVAPWFDEGLACCIQGGYWDYETHVRKAVREGTLLPYEQLRDWQFEETDSSLAYSQANHMVQFLVERFGRTAVQRVLKQVGEGRTFDQAFSAVTQMLPPAFYDLWNREALDELPDGEAQG